MFTECSQILATLGFERLDRLVKATVLELLDEMAAPLRVSTAIAALRHPHHLGLRVAFHTLCKLITRDFHNITTLNLEGCPAVTQPYNNIAVLEGALTGNGTITHLNISNSGIGPVLGALVAGVLTNSEHMSLRVLKLDGSMICGRQDSSSQEDTSGVEDMMNVLAEREGLQVTHISLKGNFLGPQSALVLAERIRWNTTIQVLDLSGNFLEAEGANALACALLPDANGVYNRTLHSLTVWRAGISYHGIQSLLDAVARRKDHPVMLCGGMLDKLKVDLSLQVIKPEDTRILCNDLNFNPLVTSLNLSSNFLGLDGALAIAAMLHSNRVLTELNLSGNWLTDDGVRALAVPLTPLLSLDPLLDGTYNNALTHLNLSATRMGPDGAEALALMLKPSHNGIYNTAIKVLNLSQNELTVGRAATIELELSPSPTQVAIEDEPKTQVYDDRGLLAIAQALAHWENLSLHVMNLWDTQMSAEAAKILVAAAPKPSLTVIKQKFVRLCGDLVEVEELDLSGRRLCPSDMVLMGYDMSHTSQLKLTLARIDRLRILKLSDTGLDADAFEILRQAMCRKSPGSRHFVRTLILSDNFIPPEDEERAFESIGRMLKGHNSLVTLDLSRTNMGARGLFYVASGVRESPSLRVLLLEDNPLHGSDGKALTGMELLGKALSQSTSVEALSLRNTGMTNEAAKVLSEALWENDYLHTLDLRRNNIVNDAVVDFTEVLGSRPEQWTCFNHIPLRRILEGPPLPEEWADLKDAEIQSVGAAVLAYWLCLRTSQLGRDGVWRCPMKIDCPTQSIQVRVKQQQKPIYCELWPM
jgi:Ran GTPase-activating protein (RanGAP) involved in mRNA processing and transport